MDRVRGGRQKYRKRAELGLTHPKELYPLLDSSSESSLFFSSSRLPVIVLIFLSIYFSSPLSFRKHCDFTFAAD